MPSRTVLETLEAARKLITPEAAWTKGWYARDGAGNNVYASDDGAVCWCMWGAIGKVEGKRYADDWAWTLFRRVLGFSPVGYNDSRTHQEVLDAFDAAIAAEKAKVTA